jgi:hypothetical protein
MSATKFESKKNGIMSVLGFLNQVRELDRGEGLAFCVST